MTKEKSKDKYGMISNSAWILKKAWNVKKSTIFVGILLSAIALILNLTELFIAPMIIGEVERGAEVKSLLIVIGGFTLVLFILRGLTTYVEQIDQFARIELRSNIMVDIMDKQRTTSYPNILDTTKDALNTKATVTTNGNESPTEMMPVEMKNLFTAILGFVIYLLLLANLNAVLVIVVVVTAGLGFFVSKKADDYEYAHRKEDSKYNSKLWYLSKAASTIELAKDMRIFGLASWVLEIQESVMKLYMQLKCKVERVRFACNVLDVILSVARNGLAYVMLIGIALKQGLSASEFLLYFTAISGFSAWVTALFNKCATLHTQSLGISAVREYLDMEEPFRFEGGIEIPKAEKYEIELKNVTYRYPEATEDTIKGMNLKFAAGEKLAIVGLNGAGKTTLVKLICGLLDPTEGIVTLNGTDIREFNRDEYYKLFATVFQDFRLIAISIAENVAQSVTDIDRDKVEKCLGLAGLTEKVKELPEGIDTKMGKDVWDEGVDLSGGQKQRLMLARALYKDAPLLILDEPTAALDPLAEDDIYNKYNEMTLGKSSIFVSHRLASTKFCDRIIFIADGKVAEEGTHNELMKKNGAYAELFEVQSRYYREGKEF